MSTVILRQWGDSDLEPYTEMNGDPEVMRHFPAPLTRAEAIESFARARRGIDERGWGVWAIEVDGSFAGAAGLAIPRADLPCMPCVEILWRLRSEYWGRGIAYAAASQALRYGFLVLRLAEIVSFTVPANVRSIRLMERLGMVRDLDGDFDHPALPVDSPLRRHVLYRKSAEAAAAAVDHS